MKTFTDKRTQRKRRQARVRARVSGTASRPRLNIYRSLASVYAQLIDDVKGVTLVSANDSDAKKGDAHSASSGQAGERKGKTAESYLVGKAIAEKAKAKGITAVVFDRAGYRYHGRVKAVADGARDGGLQF